MKNKNKKKQNQNYTAKPFYWVGTVKKLRLLLNIKK